MEPPWTELRVRELFRKLREEQPRVHRWSGPQLGIELRRIDPAFHKNVLGDGSLKRMVLRLGDLGRWLDEGVGAFEWNDDANTINVLHRDWWLAVTRDPAAPGQWLDLAELQIERDGHRVREVPERYLLIPALSDDELLAIAEKVGESRAVAQLRQEALAANDASLAAKRLRSHIVHGIERWAIEHGIDPRTVGRRTAETRGVDQTTKHVASTQSTHPLEAHIADLLPDEARSLVQQLAMLCDGDARPLLAAMVAHVDPSTIDRLTIPARLLRARR